MNKPPSWHSSHLINWQFQGVGRNTHMKFGKIVLKNNTLSLCYRVFSLWVNCGISRALTRLVSDVGIKSEVVPPLEVGVFSISLQLIKVPQMTKRPLSCKWWLYAIVVGLRTISNHESHSVGYVRGVCPSGIREQNEARNWSWEGASLHGKFLAPLKHAEGY